MSRSRQQKTWFVLHEAEHHVVTIEPGTEAVRRDVHDPEAMSLIEGTVVLTCREHHLRDLC